MTQETAILDYLKSGGKLTSLEALDKFKCFRLASRISDLKRHGYSIDRKMIALPSGKHVVQYSIDFKEEANGQKILL